MNGLCEIVRVQILQLKLGIVILHAIFCQSLAGVERREIFELAGAIVRAECFPDVATAIGVERFVPVFFRI